MLKLYQLRGIFMRRTTARRTKTISQSWVIASLVGLVLFGAFIFRKSTNNANINYVGNVPEPTAISISPVPSAAGCVSRVASASVSMPCSTQGYYKVNYRCDDGRTFTIGDGKRCVDIFSAGYQARDTCGATCVRPSPSIFPSPSPSFLPSPPPTADPSTSISCVPALFRIPPGSTPTPYNLTSFITPENELEPKDVVVKPGEFYLHGMKITNTSRSHISTAWSYFQMRALPILSDRTQEIQTQYSWREGCTIDSTDTVYCPAEHFSIPAGQSVVLHQPLFVTQIKKTLPTALTTSGYHIVLKSSASDYVIKDCGTEMMSNFSVSPSPSPSPVSYFTCVYQCLVKSRQPVAACREACRR